MFTLRMDRWFRIATGMGLLLLLTAQEKVCPWLTHPVPTAESDTTATEPSPQAPSHTGSAPAQDADKESKAEPLPRIVVDVPAPRWPASWASDTSRMSSGSRDGISCCGGFEPVRPSAAPCGAPCDWRDLWGAISRPISDTPPQAGPPIVQPAIGSVIQQTGPPRA